MDIIFMGTPSFSAESLKALIKNFNVKAVFTQPDRPSGRGNKMKMSEVKELAIENNIEVFQPEKINKDMDSIEKIKELNPDCLVVVAYGQILSREILEIPKYGCINVHASLLPKYRGASPINFAILNGEKISGITTIQMDEGIDTGPVLLQEEMNIEGLNAGELHDKLMVLGSKIIVDTLNSLLKDEIKKIPQNNEDASYCTLITKDIVKINWNDEGEKILNKINAFNPNPGAFTIYEGSILKIFKAKFEKGECEPGRISDIGKDFIKISCKDGTIIAYEIQMQNKRKMEVKEFLRGNKLCLGRSLL
ncbi:MAG: methionyl-tRNA formyltransferase [Oscillospiraceae bacterium]|nr:methionyl-tRNA formyltransferase [Oscillospiraceae bacterium]